MSEVLRRTTQFGFQFGPAEVQRWTEHKGYVSVGIVTDRQQVEIVVTPSGLIRVGKPKARTVPPPGARDA